METIQISINRQVDKQMWYSRTVEYYLATERNEWTLAIMGINLENIIQVKEDGYTRPFIIGLYL